MPLWKLQGLVPVTGMLLSFCDVSTMLARLQAGKLLTLGVQPLLFTWILHAGLLLMPALTSVSFGWPCNAQRAKPVLDWLLAPATTGNSRTMASGQPNLHGQPALMVAAAATTLDVLLQPGTGKYSHAKDTGC